jgi:hypothetical protein
MLLKKSIRNILGELGEVVTLLPPKGANFGEWKKSRRIAKQKRENPL